MACLLILTFIQGVLTQEFSKPKIQEIAVYMYCILEMLIFANIVDMLMLIFIVHHMLELVFYEIMLKSKIKIFSKMGHNNGALSV